MVSKKSLLNFLAENSLNNVIQIIECPDKTTQNESEQIEKKNSEIQKLETKIRKLKTKIQKLNTKDKLKT